ncbi:hypothetical protein CPB97_000583 [Podila verticillata]|nr:hypothetical protein CPB97_000583 [Podila verticillata]
MSWQALFKLPLSVAQSVAHKFVKFLEDAATTNIWLPRCSKMVDWEKSLQIHAKAKHTEFSGDGASFHDGGYIVHDGYCQCGALLALHNGLTCPGVQIDPQVADKDLLMSLLGWHHLILMEQQGGITFL